MTKEMVNHPAHYGGEDNPYEVIKVIEAWKLNFNRGTAVKYIPRAGAKDPDKEIEDLEKAIWYLQREVNTLKVAKVAAYHTTVVNKAVDAISEALNTDAK